MPLLQMRCLIIKGVRVIYASGEYCHNGRRLNQSAQLRELQSAFPLEASLLRVFHDADQRQQDKSNAATYTHHDWKIFKKTACQSNGKNSFGQIADKFTDIFLPARLVHRNKAYHTGNDLSTMTTTQFTKMTIQ